MRRLILVIVGLWIFNLGYAQDVEVVSKRIDSLPVFVTPIPNNNLADNLVWKWQSPGAYLAWLGSSSSPLNRRLPGRLGLGVWR